MTKAAAPPKAEPPKVILAPCILASSLSFVDGSVVNVALPALGASFHAQAADLQWIVNAYLLPLSALLLLGGAAGDRFGKQRLLIVGTALFAIASVACAAAPTLPVLLLSRALQGVGAALLLPNSLAILSDTFSGEARGRAVGIWAAAGAAAGALGPVLGGWLIDTVGWRWTFLLNVPLAVGAILLALWVVHDRPRAETPSLDTLGGVLATAALGAVTWGLTIGSGRAGWTATAIGLLVAGIALTAAFLWVQRRRGERAMMPLALFGSAEIVGLNLMTFLLYGALGGLMVLVPYLLIEAAHYSGTAAGAALLPFPVILTFASPIMGSIAARIGPRLPLTVGPLIVAVGFLLALRIGADARYWTELAPAVTVIAIGMSIAVAPLTTAVLSAVDEKHTAAASGFNSAVARTGGLVATALLGGVLAARGQALVDGFHIAALACAAASAASGLTVFFLVRKIRPKPRRSA